jgi:hypothetical protein
VSAKVISIREGACRCAQERIDAFLQDELAAQTMRWFLKHLLRCRSRQHVLDKRERANKFAVCDDTVPSGLAKRIIERIRAESARVTPQPAETKNPA